MYNFGGIVDNWFYNNFNIESATAEVDYMLDIDYEQALEQAEKKGLPNAKVIAALSAFEAEPNRELCTNIVLRGKLDGKQVEITVHGQGFSSIYSEPMELKLSVAFDICSRAFMCEEDTTKLDKLPELGDITIEEYLRNAEDTEVVKLVISRDLVVKVKGTPLKEVDI